MLKLRIVRRSLLLGILLSDTAHVSTKRLIGQRIYYNNSRVATVSTTPTQFFFVTYVTATLFQMDFDFQGNSGLYGIEVIAPDGGRSTRFNFTVVAP